MKSLSELKTNFVQARQLALAADPKTVKDAATKLYEIYKHCCEYRTLPDISLQEKAQALALANKLDSVIRRLMDTGYQDPTVAEFFGYAVKQPAKAATPAPASKPVSSVTDKPTTSHKKPTTDFSFDIAACLSDSGARAAQQPAAQPAAKVTPSTHAPAVIVDSGSGNWGADMFERYLPATVAIATDTASGTGFFISDNGYILTNHHVAYADEQPEKHIRVTSGDQKHVGSAVLIAADKAADVALLQLSCVKGKTPSIPIVADYSTVRPGDDCMIIGNAMNAGLAPVIGSIKFTNKRKFDIVYSAQTNGGDSGSPLIDRRGNCIGIHKAREGENGGPGSIRGIAYATTADKIKELLLKWKKEYKLDL